jgi:hypothetical protein
MKQIYFDDGLLDTYNVARSLLKNYKGDKILSIITGYVGKLIKQRKHKSQGIPSMDVSQIKELISEGWKIASHSVTHRDLTKLSKQEVDEELINSKIWIQNNLKVEPICFVAPYGRRNDCLWNRGLLHYDYIRSKITDCIVFHSLSTDPKELERLKKFLKG